jgi:hypothetical protein
MKTDTMKSLSAITVQDIEDAIKERATNQPTNSVTSTLNSQLQLVACAAPFSQMSKRYNRSELKSVLHSGRRVTVGGAGVTPR